MSLCSPALSSAPSFVSHTLPAICDTQYFRMEYNFKFLTAVRGLEDFKATNGFDHSKVLYCLLHVCYHCCGGCPEDMQLNMCGNAIVLYPVSLAMGYMYPVYSTLWQSLFP